METRTSWITLAVCPLFSNAQVVQTNNQDSQYQINVKTQQGVYGTTEAPLRLLG